MCPGGPRREPYDEAQLAGGVLKFSGTWRGKGTPREGGATAFILPEYDVCSDITLHVPSTEIQYDAFDITSQAVPVGNKLPTDVFQPITAKPEAGKGRNQGQQP